MSCCPPNSHTYLASDYSEKGSCHTLPNGTTEYYISGAPQGSKGILVIPDIYGWHGGRIRNIADQFYEAGYYSVVPKLLVPALNGGTDGDGCPEKFEFPELVNLLKSNVTWADHMKPKIVAIIAHMKSVGATSIAIIGFCWGGVPVVHCLSELASDFVCGVVPHPSFRLLEMVYGIDPLPVLTSVTKPVLLLPAGNDPDNLKTNGEFIKALQTLSPESETIVEFEDQQHGWVVRGDITDGAIKEKVELALNKAYAYINKYV